MSKEKVPIDDHGLRFTSSAQGLMPYMYRFQVFYGISESTVILRFVWSLLRVVSTHQGYTVYESNESILQVSGTRLILIFDPELSFQGLYPYPLHLLYKTHTL